jgi:hypothetical protein
LKSIAQIVLLAGLTLTGCKEPEPTKEFINVDERLHTFFERFENEANARGLDIDLNETDITANIEEIDGDGVAGQCFRPNVLTNEITIDESFLNSNASDLLKELVIFHELGHCFLQREHREDSFPTGACISIMRSGVGDCRDNYTDAFRATYIDELFDPDSF